MVLLQKEEEESDSGAEEPGAADEDEDGNKTNGCDRDLCYVDAMACHVV